MATPSHSGHIAPYTPRRQERLTDSRGVRGFMQTSKTVLAATLAAARMHSEDGVAWLFPRRRKQAGVADEVVWLRPLGAREMARSVRRSPGRGRLMAVLGAGCLLSGLTPEAAKAPIGYAYAATDSMVLDHPLPPVVPPVDVALFASLSLRPGHEEVALRAEGEIPDEILRFGARDVPRRLVATILKAALATDVDPVYLMALADKESGFDPEAKAATSSAEGLFQFIDATWLDIMRAFGARHGLEAQAAAIEAGEGRSTIADPALRQRVLDLRRDPYIAAVMAAEMLKRDRADIASRVGRDLTRTELYLAHFLGPQDAARFIGLYDRAKRQNAARAFRAAARANRTIFFARRGRRTTGLAVADVYGRIDEMIDRRAARFQNVMAFAADARL